MSRDLVCLGLSLFTWGIGESMFLFFQPLYLQKLGASPIYIGAILSAWTIAMAVAHIPAGYLADRIGRRPMIWISWVVGALAAWIMALANNLPVFVLGLVLYGLTSFVISPLNSYVTAARGKWSVGRAITLISASFNLGAIIGPLLGGWIGEQVGLRQIYLISACIFMLSNILIVFLRPQPIDHQASQDTSRGLPINSRYLSYLAVVFISMFAMYISQPLTPNYLQNQQHLAYEQIGQLGSISSLGVVILNLALGLLPARLGFLLGELAVGLFTLLLWRGSGLPWFAIGYFLLGGYRTARALATAQARSLVNQAQMGLAYGLTEFTSSSACVVAPLLAGIFYQQDPIRMYAVGLVLIALSLLIGLKFMPIIEEVKESFIEIRENV